MNRLNAALIKDDRTAELFQATQDPELQEKLMKEYGIEELVISSLYKIVW